MDEKKDRFSVLRIADIVVRDRIRKELGDLRALADDIAEKGLFHPIAVSEEGVLIAGYRRLEAHKLLGRDEIEVHIVPLNNIRAGEIAENTLRKDFTVSELVAIKREVEPKLAEDAEKRRILNLLRGEKPPDVQKLPLGESGRTRDNLAKATGISHETLHKAEVIVEAAEKNPELFLTILSKVDDGVLSVDRGYKMTLIKQRQQEAKEAGSPPLPEGKYDVILADPPWSFMHTGSLNGAAENHYTTMESEEIAKLPIQSHVANDAVLLLWTPNAILPEALRVMEAWGFSYRGNMVWVKHRVGRGFWFRNKHEILLLGVKGEFRCPADEDRPLSVVEADSVRHSEKPIVIYEVIEAMFPHRRFLELFARNTRDGWVSFGNEIEQEPRDFDNSQAPN